MRSDTEAFLVRLDDDDRAAAMARSSDIEEIESRLSSSRRVYAMVRAGASGNGSVDDGILAVSDYGLHWAGTGSGRLDFAWDEVTNTLFRELSASKNTWGKLLGVVKEPPSHLMDFRSSDLDLTFFLGTGNRAPLLQQAMNDARPKL
jgi:hypothetical protein